MNLRNVAIIAHVDHGKTTLVDQLFRQSGTFRDNQRVEERAMDSNDLEKERGITILAKPTSVEWTPEGGRETYHINIVDTPGHADFGAEVERILSMVDGVILLVDAAEGPMPQTKFVTGKALGLGLRPIVVVNKVDRQDARASEVLDEVFDLFVDLDASDEQLDFPVLYVAGNQVEAGRATKVFAYQGLERVPLLHAKAGDIVAIAGLTEATGSNTLCDPAVSAPIAAQPIDPPTLAMTFAVNDSPYAGREGSKVQSRVIRERLEREAEGNVAIRITESAERDAFEVAGRGELQLGVLIETMRREGFELSISRPRVLFRGGPD